MMDSLVIEIPAWFVNLWAILCVATATLMAGISMVYGLSAAWGIWKIARGEGEELLQFIAWQRGKEKKRRVDSFMSQVQRREETPLETYVEEARWQMRSGK